MIIDNCVGDPISHLLTVGSTPVSHSVLNVKAVLAVFYQEKSLVGASSVIVKTDCETDGSSAALLYDRISVQEPSS